MQVFCHHLYEYKKGLRNLVLHTLDRKNAQTAAQRLKLAGINYISYPLGETRTNLFFGAKECIEVIQKISKPSLTDYSPEEDFILGTMLGYDRRCQCKRYLQRSE